MNEKDMARREKTVAESWTEQVNILHPSTLNGFQRLFGGRLMEWIDVVAAVVARRHSNMVVTTAAVDSLEFKAPAYANDTVVLVGFMPHAGTTSMEVCVKTYVEALYGERKLINEAYVVLVALDEHDHPTVVPRLICQTDEERAHWDKAEKRRALRKQRKAEEGL